MHCDWESESGKLAQLWPCQVSLLTSIGPKDQLGKVTSIIMLPALSPFVVHSDWPGGNAVPVWPACFCIFRRLYFWWFFFRFERVRWVKPSFLFDRHRHRGLRQGACSIQQHNWVQTHSRHSQSLLDIMRHDFEILVYLKIPISGVVPACKNLDTIAIEALTIADAQVVWNTLFKIDELDPFSKVSRPPWALAPRAVLQPAEKFKFSIPPPESESRKAVSTEFDQLFEKVILMLKTIGGELVTDIDFRIFEKAGKLLYEGSFVSERLAGIRTWYDAHPAPTEPGGKDALLAETRAIYTMAEKNYNAVDVWSDLCNMLTYQRLAQIEYGKMNVLVVPTVPMHPTKAQYLADPIALNHKLGKVR